VTIPAAQVLRDFHFTREFRVVSREAEAAIRCLGEKNGIAIVGNAPLLAMIFVLSSFLDNIAAAARVRPLVIQALFMRVHDEPPSQAELEAFCDRLNEVSAAGGKLKLVQVYTVARRPAESFVAPLSDVEVDAIVALVEQRTALAAKAYYGTSA